MREPVDALVPLAHLDWHEQAEQRLRLKADIDRRLDLPVLHLELAHQHPARRRLDPEAAAGRKVLVVGGTDHRARLLFVVRDDPDLCRDTERSRRFRTRAAPSPGDAVRRPSPLEPRLVRGLQEQKRETRRVEIPLDVADVVARALVQDASDSLVGRWRVIAEQLRQPFVAVAHRCAIHLEHVAKRHPRGGARRFHQDHIRDQFPMLQCCRRRGVCHPGPPSNPERIAPRRRWSRAGDENRRRRLPARARTVASDCGSLAAAGPASVTATQAETIVA